LVWGFLITTMKEPKLKDCANESCDNQFQQFKSTVKVCSMHCAIEFAKKKSQDDQIKQAKRDKSKHKVDEMSVDKYRSTYIQPLINLLARIIDKGQPCIASKVTKGKMAGGHYHAVGHNRTLALNLHNVHIQSYHSNGPQGGQHIKYRHGLIDVYGDQYTNFVDMYIMQCPPLHLTKEDLVNVKPILQKMVNHYKKLDKEYTPLERIELRNKLNIELRIYPEEFAKYKK